MGQRRRGIGVAAFGVAACALMAREAFAFSVSYDQRMSVDGEEFTARVWVKDSKFRIEADEAGVTSVIIRTDQGVYQYNAQDRLAIRLSVPHPLQHLVDDLGGYAEHLSRHNAQPVGSEVVDDRPCEIYEFTDPVVGSTTRAWVWTERQFPVRVEVDRPQGRSVIELTHIELEAPLEDALFEIPADVPVITLGDVEPRDLKGLEQDTLEVEESLRRLRESLPETEAAPEAEGAPDVEAPAAP